MNNTIYDEIFMQYIGKSHVHLMILRDGCHHDNGSIAVGRTGSCHHGRLWCSQRRQSRRREDPRSSADKIDYNISIKSLKRKCKVYAIT